MGLKECQIVCMIHTGSRGFGYHIASDFLNSMKDNNACTETRNKQLAGVPFNSEAGQQYYNAMKCAANFALCNRQVITHLPRQAFLNIFGEVEMPLIYDVAHNIAKVEKHVVDGEEKTFIIHRKGATRTFGSGRDEVPEKYRAIGQPVLVGESMGTASYILVGTETAMQQAFGSTCHGAGRIESRSKAKRTTQYGKLMKKIFG
jgi:tRNA-splicing ligase RtcB